MDERQEPGLPRRPEEQSGPQNAKERFYDSLPVTYRQVDLFVKILAVALGAVLLLGIISGSR